MDITVYPGILSGSVQIIPSKSQAHRLLICAAFADAPTTLVCPATNQDIEATADCLRSLGADIQRTEEGYKITPISKVPESATLDCKESGSTLRFMLPIVGSLGVDTTFLLGGRLPQRPLSPLWEEMERMGCELSRPTENTIGCKGRLHSGDYTIDGSISSQFITGLIFALALINGENRLSVTGKIESAPYIRMTEQALNLFGISCQSYHFTNKQLHSPGKITVEGDWSNGAFFLGANMLGSHVTVQGLSNNSTQGDRMVQEILTNTSSHPHIYAQDIPDLVPILAVVFGANQGATFHNIGRLHLKESDRVASVAQMVKAFGCEVTIEDDTMTVYPAQYKGCIIDAKNDHRIAMAAAIGATVAQSPVTILGAECVKKSYPDFWTEFGKLGGNYEQYIR